MKRGRELPGPEQHLQSPEPGWPAAWGLAWPESFVGGEGFGAGEGCFQFWN